MSYERLTVTRTALDAVSANNTVSNTYDVSDYKNISVGIAASGTVDLTVTIYGSVLTPAELTTSSAASVSNMYAPIGFWNLDSGAFVAGTTGVVLTTTAVQNLLVNVDNIRSVFLKVTARTNGTVTARICYSNNQ